MMTLFRPATWARLKADRSAATAVEFTILAPLFLFLIMGMISFGIYLAASHSLQQLAADATRTAIAGVNSAERRSLAGLFIERNADAYPFIERVHLAFDIAEDPLNPNQFTVTLRYDAHSLPVWAAMKGLPLPPAEMRRISTIRMGGL